VEVCADYWDTAIARLAGTKSFDAVILADSFNDKSVIDLIKLIRSLEHRRLIALVIVAQTGELNRKAVIADGDDELLMRPFNPNSLIWAIDKLSRLDRDEEYLKLP
jgi:DNA-binding response OmpR family regulator